MRPSGLALTFDDGPDPVWTPRLLELLTEVKARATFFPIARRAERFAGAIERMLGDGHAIGLHCDVHRRHSEQDRSWVERDTEIALQRLDRLGVQPALWRTPWGDRAPFTASVASAHGLQLVNWTVDTHDWRGDSAEAMYTATGPALVDGAIVLAHDGLGPGARRDGAAETMRFVERVAAHAAQAECPLVALG